MINQKLGNRYGKALFQLGLEKEKCAVFYENMEQFLDLMEENEDLKKVLFHQKILPEEKKQVLKKIFEGEFDRYIVNFLYLLIDKRRMLYIREIINHFIQLLDKEESILQIEVVSAIELDEETRQQLQTKLDEILDYNIILEEKYDPEIIGGMKLKFNDYVIDGSIKNKLESLADRLNKIPVSELGVEL